METVIPIVYPVVFVILVILGIFDRYKYHSTDKFFFSPAFYAFISIVMLVIGLATFSLTLIFNPLAKILFVYSMICLLLSGFYALVMEWR